MLNLQELTDEQLVAKYASGCNASFDVLLLRHKTRLFTFIYQLVRDSDIADDIFQETFVKVITKVKQGQYSDMGKFSAWITRIARNLVIDSFRAEKSEATCSTDNADYDILNRRDLSERTIEDTLIELQTHRDIRTLVERLPEAQKEVLTMRYYRDMSFKEIAEVTGVSINTALGRMRYALINMRRIAAENNIALTR